MIQPMRKTLILSGVLLTLGCTNYASRHLDKHILAVQIGLLSAVCDGASVDPDNSVIRPSATFTIESSYLLDIGAPAGMTAGSVSATVERQGTVAVTVPFKLPATQDAACNQLRSLKTSTTSTTR